MHLILPHVLPFRDPYIKNLMVWNQQGVLSILKYSDTLNAFPLWQQSRALSSKSLSVTRGNILFGNFIDFSTCIRTLMVHAHQTCFFEIKLRRRSNPYQTITSGLFFPNKTIHGSSTIEKFNWLEKNFALAWIFVYWQNWRPRKKYFISKFSVVHISQYLQARCLQSKTHRG